ncbi:MAG: hypothetical protein JSV16_13140 [Candidatus Hydrogenedentota bacterium]|nr:MAG: hypothetical protein JSV16_13140 [Candidatus Hydrogenedentota bacterium]
MAGNAVLLADASLHVRSASKAKKILNRGQLLRALESKCVITKIISSPQGRFAVERRGWEEYWAPVGRISETAYLLDSLEDVWSAYIEGGFPAELRRNYCYRYFRLLDRILKWRLAKPESEEISAALSCVLGFECFGISTADSDSVSAAATSTMRNPSYLLTKLRSPKVLDSGEHLPLILTTDHGVARLCYHYRQHRLSKDSDIAILSYLDVDHAGRSSSFSTVGLLEQALAEGIDPFASERATRVARAGILDYLKGWTEARRNGDAITIELIDLGAGSGLVAARLCNVIAKYLISLGKAPRLRIQFIDLSMSHPARFFASGEIAKRVDDIAVVASDYRDWLVQSRELSGCDGIRLVLISRFLNNLSDFAIHSCEADEASELAGFPIEHNLMECLPTYCLAPEGPGPERLFASNARVWLEAGRTFKQASLSPYYLGLMWTSAFSSKGLHPRDIDSRVHYPVRSFSPTCLLTRQGHSILGTLGQKANLIIVQDTDMSATVIRDHFHSTCLEDLVVLDTTRSAGLRGHFSYLIAQRDDSLVQELPGDHIW